MIIKLFDIAIVGVGATGVSLLKQIQDEAYSAGLHKVRVALLSPQAEFARGKAFGDAASIHKVNTPPWMLSISDQEPTGFAQWMAGKGRNGELYPNRLTYSDFLNETYQDVVESGLLDIYEIHEQVEDLLPEGGGYRLMSTRGTLAIAKRVVLCLGSLHGSHFPKFRALPGFIDHHSQFEQVPDGRVLIAGSGLTAIDALRSLQSNQNREIHLFSRHGYAPTCLTASNRYEPRHLTWNNLLRGGEGGVRLDHFIGLLKQERDSLRGGDERDHAMRILRHEGEAAYFEYLMARSAEANLPYQDILVSTRPYMHKLWQAMPVEDRLSFHLNFGAAWAAWRHPIPYEVVGELAAAADEGRLRIHKAASTPVWERGEFVMRTDDGEIIRSTVMIDGTGGSNRLDGIEAPLVRNLLARGLVEAHPCGGIDIHPMTFECRYGGRPTRRLYNLGPLNKGSLFSTNAFWFNARCAGQWARQWIIDVAAEDAAWI